MVVTTWSISQILSSGAFYFLGLDHFAGKRREFGLVLANSLRNRDEQKPTYSFEAVLVELPANWFWPLSAGQAESP